MADRQYTVYPSADGYTVRHQGVRAHTLHSSAVQRLCVGVHGLSNNKTLIASRTIDVDHEPPPPCHMLVSLAQHLGNRKLFLICIFVDSKIGRTYDKHILSAQTRGRRQAIYLARTAFCFFKRKMCCCESKMWVTIYVFPTLARSSALIAVGLHLWSTSQLNSRLVKIIWLTSKTAAFNPPPQNKSWQ
jgi:hypothetical protein